MLAFTLCKHYGRALSNGTRYLFETLPRMLSVWLDLGQKVQNMDEQSGPSVKTRIDRFYELHKLIKKLAERLPAWQFAVAIPQLVSRICHKNPKVHQVIECIIQGVLGLYPQQTLWNLMSVSKSTVKARADRIASVFSKLKVILSIWRLNLSPTHL